MSSPASAIRLLATAAVAVMATACGSRTPLGYVPFFGDGIDDTDPDASRDPDSGGRGDASIDAIVDGRNDVEGGRDADADARDTLDAADSADFADIPDIPDLPPCFAESREGKGIPIDFYFVVDKSNSMGTDAGMQSRWSAMVNALNTFVRSPSSAGLGAGVNFFPKSSTPTGNNTLCGVNDYLVPDVPIGLLPAVAPQIATALAAQRLGSGTPTRPALEGSLSYARAQKMARATRDVAVVFVTDGQPTGCNNQNNTIAATATVAGTYLAGSPPVRTYVLGIGPSTANLNMIAQAGGTAPARLIESGGEAELIAAFNAIRDNSITCDYQIPMRPGEPLDYTLVNLQIRVGINGAVMQVGKVANAAACGPAGGWFYDQPVPPANPPPSKITLCPATCDPLVLTAGSHLDVLVGCKTTLESP
jgi:hypothetical protein